MMLFMEVSRGGTPCVKENSIDEVDKVNKADLSLYQPVNYINCSFLCLGTPHETFLQYKRPGSW